MKSRSETFLLIDVDFDLALKSSKSFEIDLKIRNQVIIATTVFRSGSIEKSINYCKMTNKKKFHFFNGFNFVQRLEDFKVFITSNLTIVCFHYFFLKKGTNIYICNRRSTFSQMTSEKSIRFNHDDRVAKSFNFITHSRGFQKYFLKKYFSS